MKYPHLESIVLIVIFILLMVLGPSDIFASGSHHEYVVNNTTTIKKDIKSAMAMATSNLHLDSRYIPLQGSIAVGSMNGSNAISFAIGKRFNKDSGLLSGSLGYEDGNIGIGSGYSFKF